MLGKVSIEVSKHVYGVDCGLSGVNILGKIELMHVLALALNMYDTDMKLFILAEESGIMKDAVNQVKCTTSEQLRSMLRGEQLAE